jgi:hypothetical protein
MSSSTSIGGGSRRSRCAFTAAIGTSASTNAARRTSATKCTACKAHQAGLEPLCLIVAEQYWSGKGEKCSRSFNRPSPDRVDWRGTPGARPGSPSRHGLVAVRILPGPPFISRGCRLAPTSVLISPPTVWRWRGKVSRLSRCPAVLRQGSVGLPQPPSPAPAGRFRPPDHGDDIDPALTHHYHDTGRGRFHSPDHADARESCPIGACGHDVQGK